MKSSIAVIALAAVVCAAAGSFALHAMTDIRNHANCLANFPGSPNCADVLNPFEFAAAHLNAFGNISLGIAAMALLVFGFVLLRFVAPAALETGVFPVSPAFVFERIAASVRKRLRWLSLCEKRDPSSALAAGA